MTTTTSPRLTDWQRAAADALATGDTAAAWAAIPDEEGVVSSLLATIALASGGNISLRDTTTDIMDALAYLEGPRRIAMHYNATPSRDFTDEQWRAVLRGPLTAPTDFGLIAQLVDTAPICAVYDAADILHAATESMGTASRHVEELRSA